MAISFILGYLGGILGFFILGGIWGLAMGLNDAIEGAIVNPLYQAITKQGKWTFIIFLPVASIISTFRKLANYLPVWAALYVCMRIAGMSYDASIHYILSFTFCFGIIHACSLSNEYYKADKRTELDKINDECYDALYRYWMK